MHPLFALQRLRPSALASLRLARAGQRLRRRGAERRHHPRWRLRTAGRRCARALRRLDALVNCAGVWVEGDSAEASEDDWQRCIDAKLQGAFFLCSRAIPALKQSRGAIVNESSDAGVVGNAGAAIYCASKGGLAVMSKALALELAPFGVRVNALCPSDIMSPMLQYQAERYGNGDPAAYFAGLLAHYPQREAARFITPDEVAAYITFLLSPAAAAVSGASASLDFGLTAGY